MVRHLSLRMAGAAVLAAAGIAALSGRTFFAASHAKAPTTARIAANTVLIKASGDKSSLVVPLRPKRGSHPIAPRCESVSGSLIST